MKTLLTVAILISALSANAAMTLQQVGEGLITGAKGINEYGGTTPDGSYNSCSASIQMSQGEFSIGIYYGDTGARVQAAVAKIAQATKSGDVISIKFVSDQFSDMDALIKIKNKKVISISATTHDKILFIPHDTTITCENLQQYIPAYL